MLKVETILFHLQMPKNPDNPQNSSLVRLWCIHGMDSLTEYFSLERTSKFIWSHLKLCQFQLDAQFEKLKSVLCHCPTVLSPEGIKSWYRATAKKETKRKEKTKMTTQNISRWCFCERKKKKKPSHSQTAKLPCIEWMIQRKSIFNRYNHIPSLKWNFVRASENSLNCLNLLLFIYSKTIQMLQHKHFIRNWLHGITHPGFELFWSKNNNFKFLSQRPENGSHRKQVLRTSNTWKLQQFAYIRVIFYFWKEWEETNRCWHSEWLGTSDI